MIFILMFPNKTCSSNIESMQFNAKLYSHSSRAARYCRQQRSGCWASLWRLQCHVKCINTQCEVQPRHSAVLLLTYSWSGHTTAVRRAVAHLFMEWTHDSSEAWCCPLIHGVDTRQQWGVMLPTYSCSGHTSAMRRAVAHLFIESTHNSSEAWCCPLIH